MNRFACFALALALIPLSGLANPVVDESTVRGISAELAQGLRDSDITVLKKYLHRDSRIIIDLDPAVNSGQQEIGYDQFIALSEMSLQMMESVDIHDEVLSVSVDEANNEATIEEKTTAIIEAMGMKLKDVSLTTTTYGVIDGQIKVLSTEDQLISSGPIE